MIYWHIQMYQPWGRNQGSINSAQMLEDDEPVIGTGEWDDLQCRRFKGEDRFSLKIGDIILVREGNKSIALCKVISDNFQSAELNQKYHHSNFRKVELLQFYTNIDPFPQPQGTLERLTSKSTKSWLFINNLYNTTMENKTFDICLNLLNYKKQIILQGPPGTGKTYFAKKIAKQLTQSPTITTEIIRKHLSVSQTINSSTDYTSYVIDSFTTNGVKVRTTTGTVYEPKFSEIISSFEKKTWLNGKVTQGNDSYSAAIAKFIDKTLDNTQFKLIQFHPAYSYEDFVRGIMINPNGQSVIYEAENKVLAKFASRAQTNYLNSKKESQTLSHENWLNTEFALFVDQVEADIIEMGLYAINNSVSILGVDEDAFRYNGNNWNVNNSQRMKFADLKIEFLANVQSRKDIKSLPGISGRSREHSSYDFMVIEKFRSFLLTRPAFNPVTSVKEEEKIFVLIIDEINRANLPAVLGELIYALEYRGESVESMYALDSDNTLTLPPNLYIIGTMNTADRSVGHIDYAIRRRFAFVDIHPLISVLDGIKDDLVRNKSKKLFLSVEKLFTNGNIASDFKASDVQLGHSYFLAESQQNLILKLEYEIKPLLLEYLKDGILQQSVTMDGLTQNTEDYIQALIC